MEDTHAVYVRESKWLLVLIYIARNTSNIPLRVFHYRTLH